MGNSCDAKLVIGTNAMRKLRVHMPADVGSHDPLHVRQRPRPLSWNRESYHDSVRVACAWDHSGPSKSHDIQQSQHLGFRRLHHGFSRLAPRDKIPRSHRTVLAASAFHLHLCQKPMSIGTMIKNKMS